MMKKEHLQTAAILVCIVILFLLFIWYGSLNPDPTEGRYPGNEELIKDYEKNEGELVEVSGKVIETDPLTIEVKHGEKTKELMVNRVKKDTDRGDRIAVFGELEENNTIKSKKVVIYPFWNYIYMYVISLLGASWLGLRIISHWSFNREDFRFETREEPLSIKDILSWMMGSDENG